MPGIGIFKIDQNKTPVDTSSNKEVEVKNILFTHQKNAKIEDSLIDYIKEHTGKLRPLAEADIYSYIEDITSYLNLGKSYHLEGIGTLLYNQEGHLNFTLGVPITEKVESKPINIVEEKSKQYSELSSFQIPVKPILLGLAILVGLAATWWLVGLVMERKKSAASEVTVVEPPPAPVVDTAAIRRDSIALAIAKEKEGKYKFVFEETNRKTRALRRFAQVNELSPRIQMETADSVSFKIYVVLPATGTDTTRIKDSLNAWYYGTLPNKIRVENP